MTHVLARHTLVVVLSALLAGGMLMGCADSSADAADAQASSTDPADQAPDIDPANADTATFAGGCFWCMEPPYDKLEGVAATISGYAGGDVPDPSYREVSSGTTGHAEVVNIIYDSTKVDYETLLDVYWRNIDPLDDGGQFCDRGSSYRPAIFARNDRQARLAEASKQEVAERFDQPIVVPVESFDAFYDAEDYHQNFYKKNPSRYTSYRQGCRRDARLEELWGDEAGASSIIASANQPDAQ